MGTDERRLLAKGDSWTALLVDQPIACAGLIQYWPGRYQAWAFMGRSAGRHMTWITKRVIEHLARTKGRIEMTVRRDFPAGQRWAKLLGFEVETPLLRQFGPEGEDHVGYVRVN